MLPSSDASFANRKQTSYVPELPTKSDLQALAGDGSAKENPSKPKFKPLSSAKSSFQASTLQPRLALGTLPANVPLKHSLTEASKPSIPVMRTDKPKPDSILLAKPSASALELSKFLQETSARNAAMKENGVRRLSSTSAVRPKTFLPGDLRLLGHQSLDASNVFGSLSSNPLRLKGQQKEEQDRLRMRQEAAKQRREVMNSNNVESSSSSESRETSKPQEFSGLIVPSDMATTPNIKADEERKTEFAVPNEQERALEEKQRQERAEDDAREARRREQRKVEMQRKRQEMEKRADILETSGQIAAAVALMKELLALFPSDEKVKARVQTLRALLLTSSISTVPQQTDDKESDDPLEELFLGPSSQPMEIATSASSIEEVKACPPEIEESVEQRIARLVTEQSDKQSQKFLSSCGSIVQGMLEIARVQQQCNAPFCGKHVKFHLMDGAVDPPPSKLTGSTDDEFTSALFPSDLVLEALQQVIKSGDEARKCLKYLSTWQDLLHHFIEGVLINSEYAKFVECSARLALNQPCSCMVSKRVKFCFHAAVPPKERLSQMVNSSLRFCLRRALNNKGSYLDASRGGSYKYAMDDVAAVAHTAMLLYESRLAVVDSIVLLGRDGGADAQIARVGEFVEAHKFLSSLFPSEQHCLDLTDGDPACFAKLRKYLTIAREFKCEDELVLSPLANLPEFVRKLKEQANLLNAARSHVEVAFKRAAKDDRCGQCTCEGARRRRAAAMGTWIAPALKRGDVEHRNRTCAKCTKSLAEKDAQVACECCELMFHPKCAGGLLSDFVCSKCVPKFKPIKAAVEEEEEE